jgi:pectate lyase, PelA/Pel-15E family
MNRKILFICVFITLVAVFSGKAEPVPQWSEQPSYVLNLSNLSDAHATTITSGSSVTNFAGATLTISPDAVRQNLNWVTAGGTFRVNGTAPNAGIDPNGANRSLQTNAAATLTGPLRIAVTGRSNVSGSTANATVSFGGSSQTLLISNDNNATTGWNTVTFEFLSETSSIINMPHTWTATDRLVIQKIEIYEGKMVDPSTLDPRIVITEEPQGFSIRQDFISTAQPLSVTASAFDVSGSISYQWYKASTNSNTGGTPIQNATENTYVVPQETAVGTHYYYVAMSATGAENAVSAVAVVEITEATLLVTHITQQPQDLTVKEGLIDANTRVTLRAEVRDESENVVPLSLTYTWYKAEDTSGTGGTVVSNAAEGAFPTGGVSGSTLIVPFGTPVGEHYFYCVISGMGPETVTTEVVSVTVTAAPALIGSLTNITGTLIRGNNGANATTVGVKNGNIIGTYDPTGIGGATGTNAHNGAQWRSNDNLSTYLSPEWTGGTTYPEHFSITAHMAYSASSSADNLRGMMLGLGLNTATNPVAPLWFGVGSTGNSDRYRILLNTNNAATLTNGNRTLAQLMTSTGANTTEVKDLLGAGNKNAFAVRLDCYLQPGTTNKYTVQYFWGSETDPVYEQYDVTMTAATVFGNRIGLFMANQNNNQNTYISNITIRELSPPVVRIEITSQPQDISVKQEFIDTNTRLSTNARALFSSAAVSYQWYQSDVDGNNGQLISGANTDTYVIPTTTTAGDYYYYCEITATDIAPVRTRTVAVNILGVPVEYTSWGPHFPVTRTRSFTKASLMANNPEMYLNDVLVPVDLPLRHGNLLMLPLSAAQQVLTNTTWNFDGTTLTATSGSRTVTLTVGSTTMVQGSTNVTLPVAPALVGDMLYMPLAAVVASNGLNNATTGWEVESGTIVIMFGATIATNNATNSNMNGYAEQWYGSQESIRMAENLLLYQRDAGGWMKDTEFGGNMTDNLKATLIQGKDSHDSSIDNGTTLPQVRYMIKMYQETKMERYRESFMRAVNLILSSQYEAGGFPQLLERPENDYRGEITFNDNAMTNVLNLWLEVYNSKNNNNFFSLDQALRDRIEISMIRGIDCILDAQIYSEKQEIFTAWNGQHHRETLEPTWAREYEPPCIVTSESGGIVRYLMSLDRNFLINLDKDNILNEQHSVWERVQIASHYATAFFAYVEIRGYTSSLQPSSGSRNVWTRFVDIDSFTPLFFDRIDPTLTTQERTWYVPNTGSMPGLYRPQGGNLRNIYYEDGTINLTASYQNLSSERRNGYSYTGSWGSSVATSYTNWRNTHTLPIPVLAIRSVPKNGLAHTPLTLSGTIYPSNAELQTIVWSIYDNGGDMSAQINSGKLTATKEGKITVRATVLGGAFDRSNYTQDFVIDIASVPITGFDIQGVTPPVAAQVPVTAITETNEYTGIVEWSPSVNGNFDYWTVYTATITLTAKSGYNFNSVTENIFTVTGAETTSNVNSNIITAVFPVTANPIPVAKPATDVIHNAFTANWDVVKGATDYILSVYTRKDASTTYILNDIPTGNVTSYPITGLISETTYYYTVKAKSETTTTEKSNEIAVTATSTPAYLLFPENGETNVASDSKIYITFNELVYMPGADLSKITVTNGATNYFTSAIIDGNKLIISHLPFSTGNEIYTVKVPGKTLAKFGYDIVWSFTVGNLPLTLSGFTPANGETNVTVKPVISVDVNYSETLTGFIESGVTIRAAGDNVNNYADAAGMVANKISITPKDLPYNKVITVTVPKSSIPAQNGYELAEDIVWKFTTGKFDLAVTDRTPVVNAPNANVDAVITLKLNNKVDINGTPNLSKISISETMGVSATFNNDVIIITHNDFAPNTKYTVTIPKDAVVGLTEDIVWSFTTGNAQINILEVTPANGATNIAANATVSMTLNISPYENAQPNWNLVTIKNAAGTPISGITVNGMGISGNVYGIYHAAFAPNTTYTVTIPKAAITGLADDYSWSFTTANWTGLDSETAKIMVYPTVTTGKVTVKFADNAVISVTDITGKQIIKTDATGVEATIALDNYSAGIYFVRVETNGITSIHKVIKR